MKNIIIRIQRRLLNYFCCVVRALVSIHKRDSHLIVYGGALDLFIDNAKHLFILNHQMLTDYRHVWLTRDDKVLRRVQSLGFEAVLSNSFKGLKLLYKAGMVIYDNRIDEFATHELSEGAVRLNLWHGIPVKIIGLIHTDPPIPYEIESKFRYKYINTHIYGDYVLATSNSLRATMSAAFQIPIERVLVSDQPRNHTLFMTSEELDMFVNKYEDQKGQELFQELKKEQRMKIIYMPTFRDADPNYIYKAIPDWGDFNEFLKDNDIVFYLKVHRVTPLPKELNYSNIIIMDNGLDIYPLLPLFDCLVTDYSSVMFDYALMRKPIILYDYDLEEYASKSRHIFNSYYELKNTLPEAKDIEQLTNILLAHESENKTLSLDGIYDYPGHLENISDIVRRLLA